VKRKKRKEGGKNCGDIVNIDNDLRIY